MIYKICDCVMFEVAFDLYSCLVEMRILNVCAVFDVNREYFFFLT